MAQILKPLLFVVLSWFAAPVSAAASLPIQQDSPLLDMHSLTAPEEHFHVTLSSVLNTSEGVSAFINDMATERVRGNSLPQLMTILDANDAAMGQLILLDAQQAQPSEAKAVMIQSILGFPILFSGYVLFRRKRQQLKRFSFRVPRGTFWHRHIHFH